MTTGYKLCKEDGTPLVNQTEYRSMVGSLLYLIASRPNTRQTIGIVVIFQAFYDKSMLLFSRGSSDIFKV